MPWALLAREQRVRGPLLEPTRGASFKHAAPCPSAVGLATVQAEGASMPERPVSQNQPMGAVQDHNPFVGLAVSDSVWIFRARVC